jgi:hypothetical protein
MLYVSPLSRKSLITEYGNFLYIGAADRTQLLPVVCVFEVLLSVIFGAWSEKSFWMDVNAFNWTNPSSQLFVTSAWFVYICRFIVLGLLLCTQRAWGDSDVLTAVLVKRYRLNFVTNYANEVISHHHCAHLLIGQVSNLGRILLNWEYFQLLKIYFYNLSLFKTCQKCC